MGSTSLHLQSAQEGPAIRKEREDQSHNGPQHLCVANPSHPAANSWTLQPEEAEGEHSTITCLKRAKHVNCQNMEVGVRVQSAK